MNIFQPNNNYKVNSNYYHLHGPKVNDNTFDSTIKESKQPSNLPEGLLQALKKWENNDIVDINKSVRWDLSRIPLKYYLSKSDQLGELADSIDTLVQSCFMDWSRASLGKIRFMKTLVESGSDISINWSETVTLGRQYECGHNDLKVVGQKIEKASIRLIIYPLIDKLSNQVNRKERLRRTLLHEIGHSLGLKHSETSSDIMFHRAITNKKISLNDEKALQELYKTELANKFSLT